MATSGCDSFFRVHGEIAVEAVGTPNCDLRVHRAADGAVRDRAHVSGSFTETFPASWLPKDYYLSIACDGILDSYKSPVVRLGFGRQYDPPFQLGRIALRGNDRKESLGRIDKP
jgi:hypothetical protein